MAGGRERINCNGSRRCSALWDGPSLGTDAADHPSAKGWPLREVYIQKDAAAKAICSLNLRRESKLLHDTPADITLRNLCSLNLRKECKLLHELEEIM